MCSPTPTEVRDIRFPTSDRPHASAAPPLLPPCRTVHLRQPCVSGVELSAHAAGPTAAAARVVDRSGPCDRQEAPV